MDNTESLFGRVKRAWSVFQNKEDNLSNILYRDLGPSDFFRPDRTRYSRTQEGFSLASIYNRIAVDVAEYTVKHIRVDKNDKFIEVIEDDLNEVFTLSANKDQTGRALMQDLVMSLFDEGSIAVVPINTSIDPTYTDSYNVLSLRVGKITQWFPNYVTVNVYNEEKGMREDICVEKRYTAIIENPFYSIMNESNSTLKRLIRKMHMMDDMDNQIASGKLDLIIQLPYVVKTAAKQELAEKRRAEIEQQLKGPYGIAYTDGTERIIQLNRPIENNFDKQVDTLSHQLYSELGLTVEVFDGTATEPVMLNYYRRTIKPVLSAIVDEYNRKFISKTARSQKQRIMYIRDPFEIVGTSQLAEIADKFTRNEILSSNEVRAIVGMYPSDDPKADELRNKNLSPAKTITEEIDVIREPTEEGV